MILTDSLDLFNAQKLRMDKIEKCIEIQKLENLRLKISMLIWRSKQLLKESIYI